MIYIVVLSLDSDDEIHPSRRLQIAHLKVDKAFTKVPSEYADFVNVFLPKM